MIGLFIADVCVVEADWLTQLVPTHCHFSEPVQEPCPRYDSAKGTVLCHMNATYGTFTNTLLSCCMSIKMKNEVLEVVLLNVLRNCRCSLVDTACC